MIFAYLKEVNGICDVYTTSLGFTSPAWAAKHHGHNVIFVDVRDDLLMCVDHYRAIRSSAESFRQPVVMPVLYGGVSVIEGFSEGLRGDEIVVIDSAHCAMPTMDADFVFFSFHPYKPICTSDGGMISTDLLTAARYFESYRNFGRMTTGITYDITQNGFKFYMNNLNATIGLTQLDRYEQNVAKRQDVYKTLSNTYKLLPHDSKSSYYFATTLVDNADEIIEKHQLARHYPMLHKTSFYYDTKVTLPNLEFLHSKILNLPLYSYYEELTDNLCDR
jgi:dTDP-4-amino-4,6-dideoxygalactose transaminase